MDAGYMGAGYMGAGDMGAGYMGAGYMGAGCMGAGYMGGVEERAARAQRVRGPRAGHRLCAEHEGRPGAGSRWCPANRQVDALLDRQRARRSFGPCELRLGCEHGRHGYGVARRRASHREVRAGGW